MDERVTSEAEQGSFQVSSNVEETPSFDRPFDLFSNRENSIEEINFCEQRIKMYVRIVYMSIVLKESGIIAMLESLRIKLMRYSFYKIFSNVN